jgi:hypothetical protein
MSWDEPRTPLCQGIVLMLEESGREVISPQLSLGQRDDYEELIDKIVFMDPIPDLPPTDAPADQRAASVRIRREREREMRPLLREIVLLALSRNYPKVEASDLRELTMSEMSRAMQYALGGPAANVGEVRTASRSGMIANGTAVAHA